MSAPLIVLNADGVLFDIIGGVIRHIEAQWGVVVKREDIVHANLATVTNDEFINADVIKQIKSPDFYWNLPLMLGAQEQVNRLASCFELAVLSSRVEVAGRITRLALRDRFPGVPWRTIAFGRERVRMARTLHARYAIEHSASTAEGYAKARILTYLIRTPYNAEAREGRFLRIASSLKEATDFFLTPLTQFPEKISA